MSSGSIEFAATTVKTGIAKDFLSDAQYGMEAVRTKVNRQGGVCGRQINVKYLDDGWDGATGSRYISGFIGENKYFGLAVNPSSESRWRLPHSWVALDARQRGSHRPSGPCQPARA